MKPVYKDDDLWYQLDYKYWVPC